MEYKKKRLNKNQKSFPNEKFLMLINIAVVSQSLEYPHLMFHYMLEMNRVEEKLRVIERLKALFNDVSGRFMWKNE